MHELRLTNFVLRGYTPVRVIDVVDMPTFRKTRVRSRNLLIAAEDVYGIANGQ